MGQRSVLVLVYDKDVEPISGAIIKVDDIQAPHTGVTNPNGEFGFTMSDIPQAHIWINAVGFEPYSHHLDLPNGNVQIRVGMPADPDRPTDIILPGLDEDKPPIPPHADLNAIFNPTDWSHKATLCGVDAFNAFDLFCNNSESLDSYVDQTHHYGFNMWRVFFMGSMKQNGFLQLDPRDFYDKVQPFADYVSQNGITLLANIFADAQDIMPNVNDRRECWGEMNSLLFDYQETVIISMGNQWPKNGWDPSEFNPSTLPWWSRGSNLGETPGNPATPYRPEGPVFEFHPRRDMPTMMADSVASPLQFTKVGFDVRRLLFSEPVGFGSEPNRNNDPNIAWRLARHYASESAGAVFHCNNGMRCQTFDDVTSHCADAWQDGMLK